MTYISTHRNCFAIRLVAVLLFIAMANPLSLEARNARKLALHDLDGRQTRLSDLDGHIVVVNFWATWCVSCREELPRLAQLAQQYAASNVSVVLVSIDEPKKLQQVRDYAAEQKLTLPIWVGASTDSLEHFSGKDVVPATLIVDEHGEIIRTINGLAREEDVKEAVDWLLSGRKGKAPADRVKRY